MNIENIVSETIVRADAKINAWVSLIAPLTIGRLEVRTIKRSESTSIIILNAFEAPAARVPPIKVAIVNPRGGTPFAARNSAGNVVTNNSSTTRNFIRAI